MNDTPEKKELKEEFINHRELAGQYGYCNPIMANTIADWWLSKTIPKSVLRKEQERYRSYIHRAEEGSEARLVYLSKFQIINELLDQS